jgi:hypothetical protein
MKSISRKISETKVAWKKDLQISSVSPFVSEFHGFSHNISLPPQCSLHIPNTSPEKSREEKDKNSWVESLPQAKCDCNVAGAAGFAARATMGTARRGIHSLVYMHVGGGVVRPNSAYTTALTTWPRTCRPPPAREPNLVVWSLTKNTASPYGSKRRADDAKKEGWL